MADLGLDLLGSVGNKASPPLQSFARGDGDVVLLFDDDVPQITTFKRQFPGTASTTPGLRCRGNISMDAANAGAGVVLGIRVQAVTPNSGEAFTPAGWSTVLLIRIPVSNTPDVVVSFDIDLSSNDDSIQPDDTFWLEFGRLADDTSTGGSGDDALGNMQLESIVVSYTKA